MDITRTHSKVRNAGLWTIQTLLAGLFLFAGGMKLIMPVQALAEVSGLPGIFMKFIAACEVLGAVGLILPVLLRIRPGLTAVAATGLAIIMIGATAVTVTRTGFAPALVPLTVGILSLTVAHGRRLSAAASRRGARLQITPLEVR